MASIYAMLSEFPGAKHVANAHLTRLTNLLSETSKGRYGKDSAITFREAARASIGSYMPAKSLELKHTIKLIQELDSEIDEIHPSSLIVLIQYSFFEHLSRCSFCHAVFKVQGTLTELQIYLKYNSVLYSKNNILRLDF